MVLNAIAFDAITVRHQTARLQLTVDVIARYGWYRWLDAVKNGLGAVWGDWIDSRLRHVQTRLRWLCTHARTPSDYADDHQPYE